MKIGRNDPCPCGSGKKYKKCCMGKENLAKNADVKEDYSKKYNIRLKEESDIEAIKVAGRLAVKTLEIVEPYVKAGVKTDDINTLVHEFTIKNGAIPAPLNYRGYPKSVCISVNEVICHGIPDSRILKEGDIVNIDVTPILNGYYADANKTFFVGPPSSDAKKIVSVARESLKAGRAMVRPGKKIGDIGWAIQTYAESHGCVPGMVFTIEPMINLGKRELHILDDGWTAVTDDGSLSAQFEQTYHVTEDGFEVLTPYDLDAPLLPQN